jgi:hypothetical protein
VNSIALLVCLSSGRRILRQIHWTAGFLFLAACPPVEDSSKCPTCPPAGAGGGSIPTTGSLVATPSFLELRVQPGREVRSYVEVRANHGADIYSRGRLAIPVDPSAPCQVSATCVKFWYDALEYPTPGLARVYFRAIAGPSVRLGTYGDKSYPVSYMPPLDTQTYTYASTQIRVVMKVVQ